VCAIGGAFILATGYRWGTGMRIGTIRSGIGSLDRSFGGGSRRLPTLVGRPAFRHPERVK
jgi:hypothetical protein